MIPSFPVKMEDQGSDAEEHMGETVCICGKVRTHLLPHLDEAFKIFRRYGSGTFTMKAFHKLTAMIVGFFEHFSVEFLPFFGATVYF
jgi:hypothetical protein